MLTFRRNPGSHARPVRGGSPVGRIGARLSGRAKAGSQDGFLLIEVLVSALLLGLIAAATVTGLQAVDDSTSNQRFHNEALLLAAQAQEQLRSSPVSALEKLITNPRTYTDTVDNTRYTITQEVHELNGKEETTGCTVVEHGAYVAPNFRVTTKVWWNKLTEEHPVKESSIITPPTSSSLQVNVDNAPSPTAGVAEVTVIVTYDAFETGTPIKLEGTTASQGCVFFTGIRATAATVEIAEKSRFVTPSGALKVPSQEVSIAPDITTRDAVTYDAGGAIAANFAYEGKTEYASKKVTGDTFVVANTEMGLAPELEVGTAGTFSYESGGEEHYTAKTGTYATSGVTAQGGHYEHGDLFPFPSAWAVYAGDCAANNPAIVTKGAVNPGEGVVTPGGTTAVAAPVSFVKVEALKGTEKHPSTSYTEGRQVMIIDTSCSKASPLPSTPNNAASVNYEHTQKLASGTLEYPFQPFGRFELCAEVPTATNHIVRRLYKNAASTGASFKIYPEELSPNEEQKKGNITSEEEGKKPTLFEKEEAQLVESGSSKKC